LILKRYHPILLSLRQDVFSKFINR
jgi:hypothetical protein